MRERPIEFDPMPAEPDKVETPAAKNKRLREQREGWKDLTEKLNADNTPESEDQAA